MSCYTGTTALQDSISVDWHDIESFYDSAEGRSYICQLCREINDRREFFGLSRVSFTLLGDNPIDVDFSFADYAGHPERNPLSDIRTILQEIANAISFNTGFYLDEEDCTYKRYYGTPTISISTLKDRWLSQILRIREKINEINLQTYSWGSSTLYFSTAHEYLLENKVRYKQFDPDELYFDGTDWRLRLAPVTSPYHYGHRENVTDVCGGDEVTNTFPDETEAFLVLQATVDYSSLIGTAPAYSEVDGEDNVLWSGVVLTDPFFNGKDKCEVALTTTAPLWRITYQSTVKYIIVRSHAGLDEIGVEWSAEVGPPVSGDYINGTVTPSSGTAYFASGDLTLEITLVVDYVAPLPESPTRIGVGSVIDFTISNPTHSVCIDGCGNYHLAE